MHKLLAVKIKSDNRQTPSARGQMNRIFSACF